jgi:hypothetical protein
MKIIWRFFYKETPRDGRPRAKQYSLGREGVCPTCNCGLLKQVWTDDGWKPAPAAERVFKTYAQAEAALRENRA